MKRFDLDIIILLVIFIVVVFGLYYDSKVSKVDLAPVVENSYCKCTYQVGDIIDWDYPRVYEVVDVIKKDCPINVAGGSPQCLVASCKI
jgi:hypothetical protein